MKISYIRNSFNIKNGQKYLMVSSSVDGAETVEACREALVDGCGHDSVTVSSTVNTLELSTCQEGWI